MALMTEHPYNGREDRVRHSSDAGFTVLQNETGNEYGEAIDRYPSKYTYSETDHPIEPEEDENNV